MEIFPRSLGLIFVLGLATGLLAAAPAAQGKSKLGSTVFSWDSFKVKSTGVGERRDVADNPTATLEVFESHISTLNPGQASHAPHMHPQEEVIILKDGILEGFVDGEWRRVGPGSIFFFASYNPHAVRNPGDKPATYLVFNFTTAATHSQRKDSPAVAGSGRLGSTAFPWEELPVKPTRTGERREVTNLPTATLANFECHVTTLRAGEVAHAPHRHPDEEIILVKEGLLEVTINGHARRAGSGSVFFYASGDQHGMRNVGDGDATYYVIRVVTEATPKA